MAPLMHPYPLALFAGTVSEDCPLQGARAWATRSDLCMPIRVRNVHLISAVIECRRKDSQLSRMITHPRVKCVG